MTTSKKISRRTHRLEKITRRFVRDLSDTLSDRASDAGDKTRHGIQANKAAIALSSRDLGRKLSRSARVSKKALSRRTEDLIDAIAERPGPAIGLTAVAGLAIGAGVFYLATRVFKSSQNGKGSASSARAKTSSNGGAASRQSRSAAGARPAEPRISGDDSEIRPVASATKARTRRTTPVRTSPGEPALTK